MSEGRSVIHFVGMRDEAEKRPRRPALKDAIAAAHERGRDCRLP